MKVDSEVPTARVTEEQFYSGEYERTPYQWLGGELVVREPTSTLHSELFGFFLGVLRITFEERGDGVVHGSEFPMRLDPKWSPEPDVMVVRDESRHRIGPQRLEGPADLVIEVASPGRRDLRLKLPRYRQARIPEIWLVNPRAKRVRVEVLLAPDAPAPAPEAPAAPGNAPRPQAPTPAAAYRTREVIAGRLESASFPGLWIDVSWLWQRPLPSILACVRQILG